MIDFSCPACGHAGVVRDDFVGKVVACPACGNKARVERAAHFVLADEQAAPAVDARMARAGFWFAIVGLFCIPLGVVALILGTIGYSDKPPAKGYATAAMILGILEVGFAVMVWIAWLKAQ